MTTRGHRSHSTEGLAEMDELQELCAFRAEVPARDAAAYARAAAVLDARMRRSSALPRRWRPRLTIPAVAVATFAIVLVPSSLAFFSWTLRRARIEGTLSFY